MTTLIILAVIFVIILFVRWFFDRDWPIGNDMNPPEEPQERR